LSSHADWGGLEQRARDAVAQRAAWRDAAAVHAGHDVMRYLVADGLQRLADVAAERGAREVRSSDLPLTV